jgi:hypothetical protein
MFAVGHRAPSRYLLQHIGSGTGVASRVIGIGMSIEGGSFDYAQFRQYELLMNGIKRRP